MSIKDKDLLELTTFKAINKGPLINYIQKNTLDDLPDTFNHLRKFLQNVIIYVYDNGNIRLRYLFIESQVREAMNLKSHNLDIHLDNKFTIKRFKIRGVPGKDGKKYYSYILTMHGLYNVLYNARIPAAEEFRTFVHCVLDNILFKGKAILRNVIKEINTLDIVKDINDIKELQRIVVDQNNTLVKQQKRITSLNIEATEAQITYNEITNENNTLTKTNEGLNMAHVLQHEHIDTLIDKIKKTKVDYDPYNPSVTNKLNNMRNIYFYKVEVFLLPHDIIDKKHDQLYYDNTIYCSESINDTDIMLYALIKNNEKIPISKKFANMEITLVYTGYVPKPVDTYMKQINQYLIEIVKPVAYKYKKNTIYETSLDYIKTAFNIVETIYLKRDIWKQKFEHVINLNSGKRF